MLPNPVASFHAFASDTGSTILKTILPATQLASAPSGGGSSDRGNEVQIRDLIGTGDRASQNTKFLLQRSATNSNFNTVAVLRVGDYGNSMRSMTALIKIPAGWWIQIQYIQGIAGPCEIELSGDAAVNDVNIGG